jgi:SAM-dependent methyltransferase
MAANASPLRRVAPSAQDIEPVFETQLGRFIIADCLQILRDMPDDSVDLVVTSPPYDGQSKYGNGERYEREWYSGFFLDVTKEIYRVLRPHGSFVLNYRSKRHAGERGTIQYELVFWLRAQGFRFCEDFVWGKPSPPPGRFNRFLKDAVEYCFQFAKTSDWQFFPENCLTPARLDARDRERRKKLAHKHPCERTIWPRAQESASWSRHGASVDPPPP